MSDETQHCIHRRLANGLGVCDLCAQRVVLITDNKTKPTQTAPYAFSDWYAGKDADAYEAGFRAGEKSVYEQIRSMIEEAEKTESPYERGMKEGRRAGIEQAAAACDDRRDQHEAAHMRAGNYTTLAMTDAWAKEAGRCAAAIRALLPATDAAEEKTDE